MMRYYGLIDEEELVKIAHEVCKCLGYGSNVNAHKLLIETAGAETLRGKMKDPTEYAGMGLTQFDKLPFEDTKTRCRTSDKEKVEKYFGIEVDKVEWEHLRYNPLLAMLFTRLKYKKVPTVVPVDMEGRAKYWKQWYNSEAGKGTVEHYMIANNETRNKYNEKKD